MLKFVVAPIANLLLVAAARKRVRKFLKEIREEMTRTINTLDPEVVPGATDRRGEYIEVYLNFVAYRIRINRAIYDRQLCDLWADVASSSEPDTFFRIDFVIESLRRLNQSGNLLESSKLPGTLAELDSLVSVAHAQFAKYLGPPRYAETTKIIRQVIHEFSTSAHG